MADLKHRRRVTETLRAVCAWLVGLIIFFPILWMVLTAFKTELHAFSNPPELLFTPTLASVEEALGRGNLFQYEIGRAHV